MDCDGKIAFEKADRGAGAQKRWHPPVRCHGQSDGTFGDPGAGERRGDVLVLCAADHRGQTEIDALLGERAERRDQIVGALGDADLAVNADHRDGGGELERRVLGIERILWEGVGDIGMQSVACDAEADKARHQPRLRDHAVCRAQNFAIRAGEIGHAKQTIEVAARVFDQQLPCGPAGGQPAGDGIGFEIIGEDHVASPRADHVGCQGCELADERIGFRNMAHGRTAERVCVVDTHTAAIGELGLVPAAILGLERQAVEILHLVCVGDHVHLVAAPRETAGQPVGLTRDTSLDRRIFADDAYPHEASTRHAGVASARRARAICSISTVMSG